MKRKADWEINRESANQESEESENDSSESQNNEQTEQGTTNQQQEMEADSTGRKIVQITGHNPLPGQNQDEATSQENKQNPFANLLQQTNNDNKNEVQNQSSGKSFFSNLSNITLSSNNGGGLFGHLNTNSNQIQNTSTTLFGHLRNNTNQQTSLFGHLSQQTGGSGLFGNLSNVNVNSNLNKNEDDDDEDGEGDDNVGQASPDIDTSKIEKKYEYQSGYEQRVKVPVEVFKVDNGSNMGKGTLSLERYNDEKLKLYQLIFRNDVKQVLFQGTIMKFSSYSHINNKLDSLQILCVNQKDQNIEKNWAKIKFISPENCENFVKFLKEIIEEVKNG